MPDATGRLFLDLSARYLEQELFPRVRAAVDLLPEEDLWWRPHASSNSVGNLLLHLAGNLGQWVVHGLGGAADQRMRDEEFGMREGLDRAGALARLESVVVEAAEMLRSADPTNLTGVQTLQGMTVSRMEVAYHAVEHFSMHTGQIIWIVKLRTGRDLGFYRIRDGNAERRWSL